MTMCGSDAGEFVLQYPQIMALFPVFCRDPCFASYLYVTYASVLNNLTLARTIRFIHLLPRSVLCMLAVLGPQLLSGSLSWLKVDG